MLSYVLRRILLAVPTLIGMTAVVFFIMALSPGRPSQILAAGLQLKPQEREALKRYYDERYGLDKPLYVQYARWLSKISPLKATFPFVKKREEEGLLSLHGLHFDLASGTLLGLDEGSGKFVALNES